MLRWLGVALLAVTLVAAVLVFRPQDEPTERERIVAAPTKRERIVAAVGDFQEAGNRMTPEEVRRSFGEPDEVFRNNPRALCWAYHAPYQIRMCWGPKRQAAWIGHNVPPRADP